MSGEKRLRLNFLGDYITRFNVILPDNSFNLDPMIPVDRAVRQSGKMVYTKGEVLELLERLAADRQGASDYCSYIS